MELKGTTAIVTGSGSGIGRAIAVEFARQGANVVCCARRAERLQKTVEQVEQAGSRGLAVPTDVTDRQQVDALVRQTMDRFGRIDVLFNNAGSFTSLGGLWEVDPDQWWQDVAVNLRGPMLTSRAVLPHMMAQNRGIIINMSGGGSTVALPGGSGYGSSKAALLRLTETLAKELARIGSAVMVFALGPGFVRTEMTEYQVQNPKGVEWIPSSKDAFEAGRTRPPEDCARSAVALIRVARPELSGRIFGTGMDFDAIAADAPRIAAEDRHVMRSR